MITCWADFFSRRASPCACLRHPVEISLIHGPPPHTHTRTHARTHTHIYAPSVNQADFNEIGARAKRGVDSAKQVGDFVQRWVKIQNSYTKGMDELLSSKASRLEKEGGPETKESVPPLLATWST